MKLFAAWQGHPDHLMVVHPHQMGVGDHSWPSRDREMRFAFGQIRPRSLVSERMMYLMMRLKRKVKNCLVN